MTIESGVDLTVTVLQGLAVLVASYVAIRGIDSWRKETVFRRKAELAEDALAMIFEAKAMLAWVRFPGGYSHEGQERPLSEAEEISGRIDRLDDLFVPIERLHKDAEFWGRFDALTHRINAVFGAKSTEPYLEIRRARNRVARSAQMLIMAGSDPHYDRPARSDPEAMERAWTQEERWERDIWDVSDDDDVDEVSRQILKAVDAMEEICRPAIEARANAATRKLWPW